MGKQRTSRLSELIREELGTLLREDIKDPRIGFVTITRVEVSADVSVAEVHLSVLGDARQKKDALDGIKSARGHIRSELGRRISVKFTPELRFHLDEGAQHSARITKILSKMEAKGGQLTDEQAEGSSGGYATSGSDESTYYDERTPGDE